MELKPLSEVDYNPTQEDLLQILRTKTQNVESDLYFRTIIAFYLSQIASSMRATIVTPHRGKLPVNMFVCALMESGAGKGYSMNIMEREIVQGFSETFRKQTFPNVSEQSIDDEARKRAVRNQTDEAEEREELWKEFNSLGAMPYSFDSGSGPAYKQVRTKAQIAGIGATNFIGDEIGTNLSSWSEMLAVNLEAYDVGLIKQKITKNGSDSKRYEERSDPVPANMLVFGTPSKLFNGGIEEREFISLLETGYGRRFLFGIGKKTVAQDMTAEELFDILTNHNSDALVTQLAHRFQTLADEINYNREIAISKDVTLINLQYQLDCEKRASAMSVFEPIRKAEMQHRYFKALKLAGVYAFIDCTPEITEEQMYAAIKLVEDSGKACDRILSQDKNYVRLAKYIAAVGKEVTYADLVEDLPFFNGSKAAKDDMMSLARAWGHRNNVIITKKFDDGFDVFRGETLKETDLNNMIFSASNHVAYNYTPSTSANLKNVRAWENFHRVATQSGVHWCNHTFEDGHRVEEKSIPEFNMVVIDVDGECSLETARMLMQDYKCFFYTTKRHTEDENRFRIVVPLKYHLKMTANEYKEFMNNLFAWLPFKVDEQTNQRCKKWLSHPSDESSYNDGELLDPTQFIPKTAKNERRMAEAQDIGDMDKVEQWFARSIEEGNRNNTILKYALMLLDGGMAPDEAETKTIQFNAKLKNGLSTDELRTTVLKTLWVRAQEQGKI